MQCFVADFTQDRVHHDEETDGWYMKSEQRHKLNQLKDLPIGTLTPTNSPFCSAGPADSTVLPMVMPTPIAVRIHSTRNRFRIESPLKGGRSVSPFAQASYLIVRYEETD